MRVECRNYFVGSHVGWLWMVVAVCEWRAGW